MVLLGLLQAGGSVLTQAVEQVTGGSLLSTLLIACAFTLSLVYLIRLAVGHLLQLSAGTVRGSPARWPRGWPGRSRPGSWGPASASWAELRGAVMLSAAGGPGRPPRCALRSGVWSRSSRASHVRGRGWWPCWAAALVALLAGARGPGAQAAALAPVGAGWGGSPVGVRPGSVACGWCPVGYDVGWSGAFCQD